MGWETLPNWIWIIYYLFLLTTLGMAIFNVTRKRMLNLSILTIVLTFMIPIAGILYAIRREEGLNEIEYIVKNLQQGEIWSIFILVLYIYILIWWILTLIKLKR